jgi:hypothetical protein
VRDALQTVPLGRSAECALRMPLWRTGGMPGGTGVMKLPYARVRSSSTSCKPSSQWSPSRHCQSVPRAGVVNARRPGHGRVEAKRRALTTSSTAPASPRDGGAARSPRRTVTCSAGEQGSCANRLQREPLARFCARNWARTWPRVWAIVPHDLGTQTRTRDTTNDGVNDPVPARWGQVQGITAGSFTPSLVL